MGESFLKQIEDELAAKAEVHRKDIRHERELHTERMRHAREVHAERMRHGLADLRDAEYKLEQVRKARKLLEAAES